MAGEQDKNLKDVKTIVECNTSMMESMMTMLQTIQCQNLKIERRVGNVESEVYSLRSKMADRETPDTLSVNANSNQTTETSPVQPDVDKEVLKMYLTEMSSDVKSYVKEKTGDIAHDNQAHHDNHNANLDQLEKKMMTKLDALMTSQGATAKKLGQLAKEVQGLKKTDDDVADKLSGLIRCSAHGSIKMYQELVDLNAASDNTRVKLTSELKTQTKSLKKNQNDVKEELGTELSVLKDIAGHQTETMDSVKDFAEGQAVELASVKDAVGKVKAEVMKEEVSTFLKRTDFSTRDDYTKYVAEHARVGMKVLYSHDEQHIGNVKGDIGHITKLKYDRDLVKVDWGQKGTHGCCSYRINLIG